MKESCAQLESEIKRTQDDKENKRQTVDNLEQQITEQREKLLRADKNLKLVLKDIKKKCACISNETILLQEVTIKYHVYKFSFIYNISVHKIATSKNEFAIFVKVWKMKKLMWYDNQQRDIAVRELQELNTLALQRVAEFMIRHVEAEAYVKKLLAEHKIDLPFYLKQQSAPTPVSSRCDSVASLSTSRTSLGQALSSRESVGTGSIIHLKPDFGRKFLI